MKTFLTLTYLISSALLVWRADGQVHGDLILGTVAAKTNAAVLPTSSATNSAAAPRQKVKDGGFVGFDQLAGFPIDITRELEYTTNRAAWADAQVNAMIPTNILALDRHRIAVDGFMIPVTYQDEKVTEFMLARDQSTCCFRIDPNVHEWIKVTAKPPGVDWIADVPVRARGTLHVGAARAYGFLTSIYVMEAENVTEASEK